MKFNMKKDLSVLTTINSGTLSKLFEKEIWCISNDVEQCLSNEEKIAEIDLDIGTLLINIGEEDIRYKFIPSPILEKVVVDTVSNGYNGLIAKVEASLVNKISNAYKDFF